MKQRYTLLLIAFCSAWFAQAQVLLPIDASTQKVTYTEVVPADGYKPEVLFNNAIMWMYNIKNNKNAPPEVTENAVTFKTTTVHTYPIYIGKGLFQDFIGTVSCFIAIECKEGRYKYTFTDFFFQPYKKNRAGKWMPYGPKKPLEATKYAGYKNSWFQIKTMTAEHIEEMVASLKSKMVYVAPVVNPSDSTPPATDW